MAKFAGNISMLNDSTSMLKFRNLGGTRPQCSQAVAPAASRCQADKARVEDLRGVVRERSVLRSTAIDKALNLNKSMRYLSIRLQALRIHVLVLPICETILPIERIASAGISGKSVSVCDGHEDSARA